MNMRGVHPLDSAILAEHGLNLQAVFEIADLPPEMLAAMEPVESVSDYRQLLLFGHGGRQMWQALAGSAFRHDEDPVDGFSSDVVARFFSEENPGNSYTLLFPQKQGTKQGTIPLQQLGKLAGWHHASPFRIGVNVRWGSWFAYRAVALADTAFTPTAPVPEPSPCESCTDKPCLSACPVTSSCGDIKLDDCMGHRVAAASSCANTCLARLACPVMQEARYSDEQIAYHYGRSLESIRRFKDNP